MKRTFQLVEYAWKLVALLLLITITFSYAMFQGGFVSWFLFYSILPFSLYAMYVVFFSLNHFTVEREWVNTEFQANDELTVKLTIKRNRATPLLFILVEDCLSDHLSKIVKQNKFFSFLGLKKELSFEYQIEKIPRGEHTMQSVRILTCDLLGLIKKEKRIPLSESILVYPAYEEVVVGNFLSHFEQGKHTSKDRVQRESSMVVGIRDYQPGDRFSWINWKASARRQGMVTKEFEQRQSKDVLLIMDSAPAPNFESIVTFTASLGRAILVRDGQIGYLSVGEERVSIPFYGGEMAQKKLFYQLAIAKASSPVSLDKVIKMEKLLSQHQATIMIVTAVLSAELIEAVNRFAARKCPVTIYLVKEEGVSVTASEQSMKSVAHSKGIHIHFIHEEQLYAGLLGVNRS